jgi:hypothetical protein
MEAAGVRTIQDESANAPQGLSLVGEDREAVLMQWERKIEQAERRTPRFERDPEPAPEQETPAPARFQRQQPLSPVPTPAIATGARRTITISGQPTPPRRRPATLAERHIGAQPDRIALWAFLLGLLLIAVAAGTAHA